MEHSDLYKINLKSLSAGDHQFDCSLGDDYFEQIESPIISAGQVEVEVDLHHHAEVYEIEIRYDGYVVGNCDRCLDELELDVMTERSFVVKFGPEYNDDDEEIIIVPETEGVLDLSWLMYEDIALSLPMQLLHEEGECNEAMMQVYQRVSPERSASETDEQIERDSDGVDLRWAALKQLKKE